MRWRTRFRTRTKRHGQARTKRHGQARAKRDGQVTRQFGLKWRLGIGVAFFAVLVGGVAFAMNTPGGRTVNAHPAAGAGFSTLLPQPDPSTLATSATGTPTASTSASPSSAAKKPKSAKKAAAAKHAANRVTPASRSFGVAGGSSLATLSNAELNSRLSGMAALGIGWVRFDVEWSNIGHAGPGTYEWTDYDRVVRAVVAQGLKPLAILDYTPTWARLPECVDTPTCRPSNEADFGTFAGAAAAHYRSIGVRTWEIWNEPNIQQYYAPKPDPGSYTAMLKAAYGAIKAVDPGAVVITGGTSPTDTTGDGSTIRSTDFLTAIYADGGKGSFDAVAHHPYTFPYTPVHAFPGGAWSDLPALHSIMSSHGDGTKQVWATEYGAPTGGPGSLVTADARKVYPSSTFVSESLQAKIATNAVGSYRKWSWVGPMFWYAYQDAGTNTSTIENFFGLLRADGSHKPAYDAYRAAIQK